MFNLDSVEKFYMIGNFLRPHVRNYNYPIEIGEYLSNGGFATVFKSKEYPQERVIKVVDIYGDIGYHCFLKAISVKNSPHFPIIYRMINCVFENTNVLVIEMEKLHAVGYERNISRACAINEERDCTYHTDSLLEAKRYLSFVIEYVEECANIKISNDSGTTNAMMRMTPQGDQTIVFTDPFCPHWDSENNDPESLELLTFDYGD
jgi:hypothetical protein